MSRPLALVVLAGLPLALSAAPAVRPAVAAKAIAAARAKKKAARAATKSTQMPAPAAPANTSAATAAAAVVPAPAAEAPVAADGAALFGLGATLVADGDSPLVADVRPGSRAAEAGLAPGDRLLAVGGRPVSSPAETAAALRGWTPGVRIGLVARRGTAPAALETAPVPAAPAFARGAQDLSPRERVIAGERAERAAAEGNAAVRSAGPLVVPVRADQSVWARFPKGLPSGLKAGDEVVAEAAAALTTDSTLDFLAVPPGSRLRARVVSASDDGELRSVRLAFYALDLKGGSSHAVLGAAAAVSGAQNPTRVSSGGTVVSAAPLPEGRAKGAPVLGPEAKLRVRLLEPLTLEEPPAYWRAGPGLWIKTIEGGSGTRLYEITHVVAGRSAEAAGLKPGERLDAIGGRSTDKLDFADALDRLYGAPGSELELSVVRGAKSETLRLKRGLRWTGASSAPLPLPYQR